MLLLTLASAPAHAGPINPWGPEVGEGVFALTPFLFAGSGPFDEPILYGQYGVTDRFELLAGAGATFAKASAFDDVELMPRLFFTDGSAAALHLTYVPGENG